MATVLEVRILFAGSPVRVVHLGPRKSFVVGERPEADLPLAVPTLEIRGDRALPEEFEAIMLGASQVSLELRRVDEPERLRSERRRWLPWWALALAAGLHMLLLAAALAMPPRASRTLRLRPGRSLAATPEACSGGCFRPRRLRLAMLGGAPAVGARGRLGRVRSPRKFRRRAARRGRDRRPQLPRAQISAKARAALIAASLASNKVSADGSTPRTIKLFLNGPLASPDDLPGSARLFRHCALRGASAFTSTTTSSIASWD